jgi:hypothetical protein
VNLLNFRKVREFFKKETFVFLDIPHHDSQQKIDVAQDEVTFLDLRKLPDGLGEFGDLAAAVA